MGEFKRFVQEHRGPLILTAFAAFLAFGLLVFGGNIRIDTEELINKPGTTLGWLTIGRYGLVLLKRILGLGTHSVIWSGILFFLFFCLGVGLLLFSFSHFAGEKARYPYWVFVLLYATSNIWCYQIYFSLQQAEIALAMLLVVVSAHLSTEACFVHRGLGRWPMLAVSLALLTVALGSYQALAVYYVAVCAALFLLYIEHWWQERQPRDVLAGIVVLLVHFLLAYGAYSFIANRWFMAAGIYMDEQRGWGRLSTPDCIKNILRLMRDVFLMRGPENFSFYVVGALLVLIALGREWMHRRTAGNGVLDDKATPADENAAPGLREVLRLLALAVLLYSPFLMVTYSGEKVVTRTQFALPFAAAFLGMYGIGKLQSVFSQKAPQRAVFALAVLAAAVQVSYGYRLTYTDNVRYAQDMKRSERLLDALGDACGQIPEVPVLFVGQASSELTEVCILTEMYGWSFYEWDYSEENPTGATHRICGFIEAYSGVKLSEGASEEQREKAAELAVDMQDFPGPGSIRVTEDMVVVRLSEISGRGQQGAPVTE